MILPGRYLSSPPKRRRAEPYDFWWNDDDRLVVRLPLTGDSWRSDMDVVIPAEDHRWLFGPREAPSLAVPIHAHGGVSRGFAGVSKVEWEGMLSAGKFIRLKPDKPLPVRRYPR